jgi:predicted Zn-dependent peptidase
LHDWPHPRDYAFDPSEFAPPNPDEAFIEAGSGVRAYVIPSSSDPLVRMTAAFPLGRLFERAGEAGAARLLAQLLAQGPVYRSLSLRLEALGTELQVEQALDVTQISLEVLADDWGEGLEILIDLLEEPDFDDELIRNYRTGPGFSTPTSRAAEARFRPKVELERILGGYPLAPPDEGLRVTPKAVRALASRSLRADRVVLGAGGNVPRAEFETALNRLTANWEVATELPELGSLDPELQSPGSLHTVDVASLQGWIAIGRAIGSIPESERAALTVLGEILGERLNIAAREMRGLCNRDIFLLPETSTGAGLLHIRTGGRWESVAPLIKFSLDEVFRIHDSDQPISEEERERAIGSLVLGKWQEQLDGPRQASATYAVETVRYGGTDRLLAWPDALRNVTFDQMNAVASKYLNPEEMVTVVVGPLEKIRQARHPRWPFDLDTLVPSR